MELANLAIVIMSAVRSARYGCVILYSCPRKAAAFKSFSSFADLRTVGSQKIRRRSQTLPQRARDERTARSGIAGDAEAGARTYER
jgi:hypothetical protein